MAKQQKELDEKEAKADMAAALAAMMKDEFRAKNLEYELETVKDETIVTGHKAAKRDSVAGPGTIVSNMILT
jgi:hypothetical protein